RPGRRDPPPASEDDRALRRRGLHVDRDRRARAAHLEAPRGGVERRRRAAAVRAPRHDARVTALARQGSQPIDVGGWWRLVAICMCPRSFGWTATAFAGSE